MYQNSWEILGALFHKQFIYIHRSQWVCEGVPLELICSELIYSERLFGPLIFGHAHIKRCWKQLVQSLCNLHSCKLTWLLEHPHVQYQYISSNGGFSVVMLVFRGIYSFSVRASILVRVSATCLSFFHQVNHETHHPPPPKKELGLTHHLFQKPFLLQ